MRQGLGIVGWGGGLGRSVGEDGRMCLPILTTGQDFLHSCLHFFGLHLSVLTMAILVRLSDILKVGFEDGVKRERGKELPKVQRQAQVPRRAYLIISLPCPLAGGPKEKKLLLLFTPTQCGSPSSQA